MAMERGGKFACDTFRVRMPARTITSAHMKPCWSWLAFWGAELRGIFWPSRRKQRSPAGTYARLSLLQWR